MADMRRRTAPGVRHDFDALFREHAPGLLGRCTPAGSTARPSGWPLPSSGARAGRLVEASARTFERARFAQHDEVGEPVLGISPEDTQESDAPLLERCRVGRTALASP